MIKKELIVFLAALIVITACTPQGTGPANPDQGNTGNNTEPEGTVTAVESDLEYCKMILKTAQAQVNTFDRQEKTLKNNIDTTKKKITELKAIAGNEEAIAEEQEDLEDLNSRLQETQASLTDARTKLADATAKCAKIAKKGDKAICKEFNDDLQKQTQAAQNSLGKEES